MTIPAIVHPELGMPVKLGRNRPHPDRRRRALRASTVLGSSSPPPPDFTTASPLAQPCLDRMLMNDVLSDCTTVTTMKCSALVNGDAGTPIIYSNAQAVALYSGSTGYDGTAATDQGGDEETVIDYVIKNGIEKNLHHWAGKMTVDGSNRDEVKTCLWRFKHLYFGVELADDWLRARNSSRLTSAGGPNPNNGHAFTGKQYSADGVVCNLWGGIEVEMPWDVLAEFTASSEGGELHVMITTDMIRRGLTTSSDGFDWPAITQKFIALGGNIPKQLQHLVG